MPVVLREADFRPALERALHEETLGRTVDIGTFQTLERASRGLCNRIAADPRRYIMTLEEYNLLNYYQRTFEHDAVVQQAIQRYRDSLKGDVTAPKAGIASSEAMQFASTKAQSSPRGKQGARVDHFESTLKGDPYNDLRPVPKWRRQSFSEQPPDSHLSVLQQPQKAENAASHDFPVSPDSFDLEIAAKTKANMKNSRDTKFAEVAFKADLDDTDNGFRGAETLRSNIARNETRTMRSTISGHRSKSGLQGQLAAVNHDRRLAHEERLRFRNEIYENSWLALSSRFRTPNARALDIRNHQLHIDLQYKTRSLTGTEADLSKRLPAELLEPAIGTARVNPQGEEAAIDHFRSDTSWFQKEIRPYLMLLRNIGALLWSNWLKLSKKFPTKDSLSAIVLSKTSEHVVDLKRIEIRLLRLLIKSLEVAMTITDTLISQSEFLAIAGKIHMRSYFILQILHPSKTPLPPILPPIEESSGQENPIEGNKSYMLFALGLCETTLERLDLAILSYEGAHTTDLPDSFKMSNSRVIRVFNGQSWVPEHACSGCVMRLPLKCLAPFLGYQDVWVFCDDVQPAAHNYYLATDIETFADIWGPVWKVWHPKEKNQIIRYNVGGGSVVPWPENKLQHPPLARHQRLCHWTRDIDLPEYGKTFSDTSSETSASNNEGEDSEKETEISQQQNTFHGSEMLLIGAKTSPQLQWKSCRCSLEVLKRYLKEAGRLSHLLSSKSYRYVDAQQASLVVGSHGVQIGTNKTYKYMREEPLKIGLLSMWENEPEARDPREFENFWGVAISICTMNARRVRLIEILGEDSVLLLLKHFRWSDQDSSGRSEKRRCFFEAVRSLNPRSLGDLWDENPTWREDVGSALLICLRVLAKTGFDGNRHELSALWLPPGCHGPRRVTIKPEDQTWTKILKDNTYSMTVAVIVDDKLGDEPPCKHGDPQWFRNPSVLETAISINRAIEPTPDLLRASHCSDEYPSMIRLDQTAWRQVWEVSNLDNGKCFWIGPEDRLKVLRPLSKWHLLLQVDTVKRAIIRDWIGMKPSERISHWEYTDEGAESVDVRPIPVHITS